MTYSELIRYGEALVREHGKEESAVKILLLHVFKMESYKLIECLDEETSKEFEEEFKSLLNEYVFNNKPVQYLTGYEYFYGYPFKVNSGCLIPRPETEELVGHVLETYDEVFDGEEVRLVDIGTGSGAIAISLSLEEPRMTVSASDISFEALEVAKTNAKDLEAKVTFKQGDMLEPFKGEKFDILVSNPPYIPDSELPDSLVLDNEPHVALFGGVDGLKFYRIILSQAKEILNEKSFLAFEHGYDKAKEMYELAKLYFPKAEIRQYKDLSNKDRMTFVINR